MVSLEARTPMRDGIHTTLPLPLPWRRVLEVLGNEAESPREKDRLLGAALLADARRELDSGAIRRLVARLGAAQPPLFRPDARSLWALCVGDRAPTPLEERWVKHTDRAAAGGPATPTDFYCGLKDALSERMEAREVDTLRHVSQESPEEVPRIRECFDDATRSVPVGRYADEILGGRLPVGEDAPPLDFDEGLPLGPKAS